MRNFLRNKLLLSIIFSFCFTTFAAAENLCANKKAYNIGFFNGVGNSWLDARKNMDALQPLVSTLDSYNMPVKYTLFYNRTKGYILDVTEVFAQKYEELGLSLNGKAESYFELFWYILNYTDVNVEDLVEMSGDPYIKTLYELIKKIPEYVDLDDYLKNALASLTSAALTAMVTKEYNGTTLADYKIHDDSLKNLLAEDYNVVLVAHSQGNLFAAHAYEDIVGSKGAYPQSHGSVNVVHVAPVNAVSNLKGESVLNGYDKVIRALRSVFHYDDTVIPRVYEMIGPDKSYHQFTKSYLAENSQCRERIGYYIQKAFEQERENEQHNLDVRVTFETFYDRVIIPHVSLYTGFIPPKRDYCGIPKNASSVFCADRDEDFVCGYDCPYGIAYETNGYFDSHKQMMAAKAEFYLYCRDNYAASGKYRLGVVLSSCNYVNGKCEPFTHQIYVTINDHNFVISKQTIPITPDHSSEFIIPNEFILDVQRGKGLENIKVSFQ